MNYEAICKLYLRDLELLGRSPATLETNGRWLRRLGEWLGGREPEPIQVLEFVFQLKQRKVRWPGTANEAVGGLSPFSVAQAIRVLKGFGNWCERGGFGNPGELLKRPKLPQGDIQVLPDAQIQTLLASLDAKTAQGARQAAILTLMLDSGPRAGEVAGAMLDDLDLDRRVLRVHGKGGKWRLIPFGATAARALNRYLGLRDKPMGENRLFLAADGWPMTSRGVYQMVRRFGRRCQIPDLHPHQLRHTFAVKYLLAGGDLASLQDILGHESIMVTRQYLRFLPEHLQAQHSRYSPVDLLQPRRFSTRPR